MSITWTDVEAAAPELSSLATATQTSILATVELFIDDAAWGDFADKGRVYLAAHLGTISSTGSGSGSGAVTEESIGPFSRTYASPTDESSLASTKYGQFYKFLMRTALAVSALAP